MFVYNPLVMDMNYMYFIMHLMLVTQHVDTKLIQTFFEYTIALKGLCYIRKIVETMLIDEDYTSTCTRSKNK